MDLPVQNGKIVGDPQTDFYLRARGPSGNLASVSFVGWDGCGNKVDLAWKMGRGQGFCLCPILG